MASEHTASEATEAEKPPLSKRKAVAVILVSNLLAWAVIDLIVFAVMRSF